MEDVKSERLEELLFSLKARLLVMLVRKKCKQSRTQNTSSLPVIISGYQRHITFVNSSAELSVHL